MTYSVVSLFSGAGFLDLGFAESGFNIDWGCELIPEFAESNNYNMKLRYGHRDIVQVADITKVHSNDIPHAMGIIGGPPCQDFSIGNANNPGVTGARGSLVWNYLKRITDIEPDFFLFENVEALYKTRKHRNEALLPLVSSFEALGYSVQYKVLNALEFGVPQDRSRLFIVGFKERLIETVRRAGYDGFQWPHSPNKAYVNAKKKIFLGGPVGLWNRS